jgi:hypothetical protein
MWNASKPGMHRRRSKMNCHTNQRCSIQNQQKPYMIWHSGSSSVSARDFALDQTRLKFFRLASIIFHFL